MQKATADEKPMHYGIGFYPAWLPFLFMSNPKIFFPSMNCLTFGINDFVIHQLNIPAAATTPMWTGESRAREPIADMMVIAVVYVNWLIDATFLSYY